MPPELRDLLDHAVQQPPTEPHTVESVVRRAETSRRRHRTVLAGAASAAVLAVVAGAAAVAGHPFGDDDPAPADNRVVGPVVHTEDARPARAGADYTVVATTVDRNLDRRNGRLHPGVDEAGEVLVRQPRWSDPGDPFTERDDFGVLDPDTGRVAWLPAPPGATYATDHAPSGPRVVQLTADHVLWVDDAQTGRTWSYHVYDRAARTWHDLDVDVSVLGRRQGMFEVEAQLGDGRLWFRSGGGVERSALWSLPLDGSTDVARREARVGNWAVDDDRLVWTRWDNRPNDRVTVRDLRTGDEHGFDPRSGDRCNQLGMTMSGDRIALGQYCGEHRKVRDDRVQVVDTSGDPVVTVQGDGVEMGGLGRDFLLVTDYSRTAGTFVYDFSDGRLLRLSASLGKFSDAVGAGGATLTWNTAVNHHHGIRLWTATWR